MPQKVETYVWIKSVEETVHTFEIYFPITICIKYVYNTLDQWVLLQLW